MLQKSFKINPQFALQRDFKAITVLSIAFCNIFIDLKRSKVLLKMGKITNHVYFVDLIEF